MKRTTRLLFGVVLSALFYSSYAQQKIHIQKIVTTDSVITSMIEDYLTLVDSIHSSDFIMIYVDTRDYCFRVDCTCPGPKPDSIFKIPSNTNKHAGYRFGFSIIPNSSSLIIDKDQYYKSKYLFEYKDLNIILTSRGLVFDVESEDTVLKVRREDSGQYQEFWINYDYEVGAAVHRLERTLIYGKDF